MGKELCRRNKICAYKADGGCDSDDMKTCDILVYIEKELNKFAWEVKKVLNERDSFSYDEPWYKKLRHNLVAGTAICGYAVLVSEKEFMQVEDEIVKEFINRRG